MTIREHKELQVLKNLVNSTHKKLDNTKKKFRINKQENEGLNTRSKVAAADKNKMALVVEKRSSRPDPQF